MTRFLPSSTNGDDQGRMIAARSRTWVSIGTIVPGGIHAFLPDGGAGVIAGLDLTQNGTRSSASLPGSVPRRSCGMLMLLVSLVYRSFVPLCSHSSLS